MTDHLCQLYNRMPWDGGPCVGRMSHAGPSRASPEPSGPLPAYGSRSRNAVSWRDGTDDVPPNTQPRVMSALCMSIQERVFVWMPEVTVV